MSNLERALAKNKMASSRQNQDPGYSPWRAAQFERAAKDLAAGCFKAQEPRRYPVIISADTWASSPEKVQKLAGIEAVPEVTKTVRINEVDKTETPVTICDVSEEESERIEERADVLEGLSGGVVVMFRGKERFAIVVKGLKKGVKLGLGEEGESGKEEKVVK